MKVETRLARLAIILNAMDTVGKQMICEGPHGSFDTSGRFLNLSACLWIETKAMVQEHGAHLTLIETVDIAADDESAA